MPTEVHSRAADKLAGTAGTILDAKGRVVHAIGPQETVYAAVAKLSEYRIGALFVMDGGKLVGVLSERDYARKIILEGRASRDTRVAEIMSSPVVYVETATPLSDCMRLITQKRIRHLPVMEHGEVIGVVSIGDLVQAIMLQQEQTIEQLSTLITDPYPA